MSRGSGYPTLARDGRMCDETVRSKIPIRGGERKMANKEMTRREFLKLGTTVGLAVAAPKTTFQVGETRFDAKAVGAKGDGTTNDTAVLQAIIDRAPAESVIHY